MKSDHSPVTLNQEFYHSGFPDWRLSADQPQLIKTHNKTGYITTYPDPVIRRFLKRAVAARMPILELGAGYGLPSIEAVRLGALRVVISDLDDTHLTYARLQPEYPTRIQTVVGGLPHDLSFQPQSFEIILISRVLHFFSGSEIAATVRNIKQWLTKGGEAYVVTDSLYCRQFSQFQDEYARRRANKARCPGYFINMQDVHGERSADLPDTFHFFELETLTQHFLDEGFQICETYIFARPEYPFEKQLDGREALGIVVKKPH